MVKLDTLIMELGRDPHNDCGSVNPPVHRTSTLIFDNFAQMRDYESGRNQHFGYARHNNATTDRLCQAIAVLEGGDYTVVTSSGLAATVVAILTSVSAGEHILFPDSIYSSTRHFVEQELPRLGISFSFYNPTIDSDIAKLFKPETKAVYTESPGSLTFEMQDIPAIAKVAHAKGAMVIADNTWATPIYAHPFEMGIDLSIQSVTKYIAGHSDLVMGAVTCKQEHAAKLKRTFRNYGMSPGTDNIYLALRGMRTVKVRLRQHEISALQIAQWLEKRPEVVKVLYPALPSHPGHALFKRDLKGASGLFAFELKNATEAKVGVFIDALEHFGIGYSWGGYESLIIAYQPGKLRTETQWDKESWLIRIHVGLEDIDDLIADLDNAFKAIEGDFEANTAINSPI